jgi:hypothetical protein
MVAVEEDSPFGSTRPEVVIARHIKSGIFIPDKGGLGSIVLSTSFSPPTPVGIKHARRRKRGSIMTRIHPGRE